MARLLPMILALWMLLTHGGLIPVLQATLCPIAPFSYPWRTTCSNNSSRRGGAGEKLIGDLRVSVSSDELPRATALTHSASSALSPSSLCSQRRESKPSAQAHLPNALANKPVMPSGNLSQATLLWSETASEGAKHLNNWKRNDPEQVVTDGVHDIHTALKLATSALSPEEVDTRDASDLQSGSPGVITLLEGDEEPDLNPRQRSSDPSSWTGEPDEARVLLKVLRAECDRLAHAKEVALAQLHSQTVLLKEATNTLVQFMQKRTLAQEREKELRAANEALMKELIAARVEKEELSAAFVGEREEAEEAAVVLALFCEEAADTADVIANERREAADTIKILTKERNDAQGAAAALAKERDVGLAKLIATEKHLRTERALRADAERVFGNMSTLLREFGSNGRVKCGETQGLVCSKEELCDF